MKKSLPLIIVGIITAILILVVVTAALTPAQTSPAFAAAEAWGNAAARGQEAIAVQHEGEALREWAAVNCPEGRVSACVQALFPPEWGEFISVLYRRAVPDGDRAWDVELIGSFQRDDGGSGICVYTRVEQNDAGVWLVEAYAGWVWCGDPASRNMADNPDAPNRAPRPTIPVMVEDARVTADGLHVLRPAGWRVITSAVDAPFTLIMAAPDGCGIIIITRETLVIPPTDCAAAAWEVTDSVTLANGMEVFTGLRLPTEDVAFRDALIASILSAG